MIRPDDSTFLAETLSHFPWKAATLVRRRLERWYAEHGRHLPWREARDPYRVWISEIMLQQTTVAAVIPYFERFLARFPDVHTLAAADQQDVLRLWEGLGYYSRARNLHAAAVAIVHERNGEFPCDVDMLMSLPGVGRYTAGAIASFAFDVPAPIVEANTLRLYCRLLGYEDDPKSTQGQALLWSFAERLLPSKNPGTFNQSLMDLGATVCTPTDPKCSECPLQLACRAFQNGLQNSIPRQAKRIATTDVAEVAIAIRRGGSYLLRQRPQAERWAGLWDFPRLDVSSLLLNGWERTNFSLSSRDVSHIRSLVRDLSGMDVEAPLPVMSFKHSVTRFRITLHCLHTSFVAGRLKSNGAVLRWVRPQKFAEFPLTVPARRIAVHLCSQPLKISPRRVEKSPKGT